MLQPFAMQVSIKIYSNFPYLLIIAHDCELNFVDVSKAAQKVKEKPEKVFYRGNPFLNGIFLNETTFIACGFDKIPFLFKKSGNTWNFEKHLDEGANQVKEAQIAKGSFD